MWNSTGISEESDTSGGYLNDSRGSHDGRKETLRRTNNIVPVMIRHLTQSDEDLYLWEKKVHIVTFLGIVRNVEQTSTKITYEIEDETGSIKASRWLEAMGKPDSTVSVNTYVRVYGHVREQNETKYVLILEIAPLTNLNELTSHLLEVTATMLKAEKEFATEKRKAEPMDQSKSNDHCGLTSEQILVFRAIQQENHTENGIDREKLRARMPDYVLPFLDDIIDFLTSEGHIYTTLTDDHFKTT